MNLWKVFAHFQDIGEFLLNLPLLLIKESMLKT